MEKNLELIKKEDTYVLMDGDSELMKLEGLKVDSQVLFSKIYINDNLEEREFKVNVTSKLNKKEDKYILEQLQNLFNCIEEKIKLQFKDGDNE